MQSLPYCPHERIAQDQVGGMSHAQGAAYQGFGAPEMLGHPGSQPVPGGSQPLLAEFVGHVSHVDVHGTGGGTQAVSGAGDLSGVLEGFFKSLPGLSGGFSAGNLPLYYDSCP